MTIVTNEIPPVRLTAPLDEETVRRAGLIRWQWALLYSRVRSMPRTHATEAHMAQCEKVIAIIDALLAANVTTH